MFSVQKKITENENVETTYRVGRKTENGKMRDKRVTVYEVYITRNNIIHVL